MARAIYSAPVGAAVALVAATPKTILAVIAPTQFGIDLVRYELGFDSVTATDRPVTVEFVSFTSDGTGSPGTMAQTAGRLITTGFTSKYNYSVEPTGATVLARYSVAAVGGTVVVDFGDRSPIDSAFSTILGLRLTSPAGTPNANATLYVGRC